MVKISKAPVIVDEPGAVSSKNERASPIRCRVDQRLGTRRGRCAAGALGVVLFGFWLGMAVSVPAAVPGLGDLDGDGRVTVLDVVRLAKLLGEVDGGIGLETRAAADVNLDGALNGTDVALAAALAAFASNFEDAVAVGAAVGTGVGAPGVDPGFCALATCAGAVGAALGTGSG